MLVRNFGRGLGVGGDHFLATYVCEEGWIVEQRNKLSSGWRSTLLATYVCEEGWIGESYEISWVVGGDP